MGLLDSFEKGLKRAVNSAFAKTFRSGIQPVEIASALRQRARQEGRHREPGSHPRAEHVHGASVDGRRRAACARSAVRSATSWTRWCTSTPSPRATRSRGPSGSRSSTTTSSPRARSASSRPPPRAASPGAECLDIEGKRHPIVEVAHGHRARQRRRHHDLQRGHEPQARRDPVGRRARDGARSAVDQRHAPERSEGHRSRAWHPTPP